MTHSSWPGTARKLASTQASEPAPGPTRREMLRKVGIEFAAIAAVLALMGGLLVLIEHLGSAGS